MKTILLTVLSSLCVSTLFAQKTFSNIQDFFAFAETKNINLQANDIKLAQAKKAKLAAMIAIADPTGNNSLNYTDNLKLPVSVFPSDAFGGTSGSVKEVALGVKYNTSFTQTADIKLLNLEGWQNLKLAKINIATTENDRKMNLKSLYENIASAYYNIVQLKAQLASTQQNLWVADTLLQIATSKYAQGIAKQQDVNDSRVSYMTIKENINQITFLITQQYNSLKILCDIPANEDFSIEEKADTNPTYLKPTITNNTLLIQSNTLKEESALATFKRTKLALAPTLSLVLSNSYNQYNQDFTVFGGKWINSQYIGFKLNIPVPNANMISNKYNAQYNYQLAQKNTQQAIIKSNLETQQLSNDWEKAYSQEKNYADILKIQQDTYQKNKNLYQEGLLGLDRTLNSLNALVNAGYNVITATVNLSLAQAKIDINNRIY